MRSFLSLVALLSFLVAALWVTGWTIVSEAICFSSFLEAPVSMCFAGNIFVYEVGPIARFFDANELGNTVPWNGITVLVNNAYYGIGFINRFFYFPVIFCIALALVAYLVGGLIRRALDAAEE